MVSTVKQSVHFLELIEIVMKFYVTQRLQEAVHVEKKNEYKMG